MYGWNIIFHNVPTSNRVWLLSLLLWLLLHAHTRHLIIHVQLIVMHITICCVDVLIVVMHVHVCAIVSLLCEVNIDIVLDIVQVD